MSGTPAYSAWHPRRLPERQASLDSQKIFSSRPATPTFGQDLADMPIPRRPHPDRSDSQSSLLTFHLAPDVPRPAPRRTMHARVQSIANRVPLPQGVSLAVGICTAVAFILSITTLAIGMANRRMLQEATEQRHDPHSALMRMIYTVVLEALEANFQNTTIKRPPIDAILPPP